MGISHSLRAQLEQIISLMKAKEIGINLSKKKMGFSISKKERKPKIKRESAWS